MFLLQLIDSHWRPTERGGGGTQKGGGGAPRKGGERRQKGGRGHPQKKGERHPERGEGHPERGRGTPKGGRGHPERGRGGTQKGEGTPKKGREGCLFLNHFIPWGVHRFQLHGGENCNFFWIYIFQPLEVYKFTSIFNHLRCTEVVTFRLPISPAEGWAVHCMRCEIGWKFFFFFYLFYKLLCRVQTVCTSVLKGCQLRHRGEQQMVECKLSSTTNHLETMRN